MNKVKKILARMKPEDRLFYDWQFALAQRIVQIMEEQGLTQRELAKRARLTEAQVSALIHVGANPSLSTLARISALVGAEFFTWMNTDLDLAIRASSTVNSKDAAVVYRIEDYSQDDGSTTNSFPVYRSVAAK